MSQTELDEFAIHDRRTGALEATIAQQPDGAWSTRIPADADSAEGAEPALEDKPRPQAAFDAFIASKEPTAEQGDAEQQAGQQSDAE
ncbi:hypothetical protein ACEXQD_16030 [Herbiconiux sp. P15]|uniref:hypothetical protein n=1 Tax=Herbiconiux liukaitaii TaxID=3342799 RepID=UPI0035BAC49D